MGEKNYNMEANPQIHTDFLRIRSTDGHRSKDDERGYLWVSGFFCVHLWLQRKLAFLTATL